MVAIVEVMLFCHRPSFLHVAEQQAAMREVSDSQTLKPRMSSSLRDGGSSKNVSQPTTVGFAPRAVGWGLHQPPLHRVAVPGLASPVASVCSKR